MNDTSTRQDEEQERQYTLSIGDDAREESFRTEDDRWERGNQIRDWIYLVLAIAVYLGIQLSVYFLEPGLK